MDSSPDLNQIGREAKQAAQVLAGAQTRQKNVALKRIAEGLEEQQANIVQANREDLAAARASGMDAAMLDRLSVEHRLEDIARDVHAVEQEPDPIGEVFYESTLPNGLRLSKQRTALGVLGVIYEARPNVTIDVAVLSIKTGNAAVLRGGKEALLTNQALAKVVGEALELTGLPSKAIQLIGSADRQLVLQLLQMQEYLDLIIPRGGALLHQFCREHSRIPVITGGIGVCHMFVDESASINQVLPVLDNAKTQRPTVCNALDTVLVHGNIADSLLPQLSERLGNKGVRFSCDVQAEKYFADLAQRAPERVMIAAREDWDREWLGLTLGVRIVNSLDEAIHHIKRHSSGHSDGILTENEDHAKRFIREVDSAAVYVNASTRFTDGSQFGLGSEVAISTQKLRARGPMGLPELTSYKWVVQGDYHTR